MKLKLNMPFEDLSYRFNVSLSTVSRIFQAWMIVMHVRLRPLIKWPDREDLWHTMPQCFQNSFGKKAWGGRTSDKFLTDNCGILGKIIPGDLVLADRGFTIQETLMFKQAELAIPAFTRGKDQLDPVDVEETRGIANVRIHVERVIGLPRRKYTILSGILPIDFPICNPNGSQEAATPMIDRIINVCSALVNLCPGIVPFD